LRGGNESLNEVGVVIYPHPLLPIFYPINLIQDCNFFLQFVKSTLSQPVRFKLVNKIFRTKKINYKESIKETDLKVIYYFVKVFNRSLCINSNRLTIKNINDVKKPF
jgi:hypothetical protein